MRNGVGVSGGGDSGYGDLESVGGFSNLKNSKKSLKNFEILFRI